MTEHVETQYDSSSPGGLDTPLILMVGIIGVVLFIVIYIATQAWFFNQQRAHVEANFIRSDAVQFSQVQVQDNQLNQLHRVVGQEKRVTIPIDHAMDLYLEQLKKK